MKKYYIVVTPFFPTPDSFRGPFVYDQVKALKADSNYEVVVFRPKSFSDKTQMYEYNGIKVYLFPVAQTPSYLFNGLFNGFNSRQFVKKFNSLGLSPDDVVAVHCHTSSFGECGLALKKYNPSIKVILQHHDKDPFTILNGKLSGWKINSRYRAKKNISIFNSVDIHVCISNACKANLLSFPDASDKESYAPYLAKLINLRGLPRITPRKVVLLHNGVNVSKFYKTDSRKNDRFVIGCVANFINLKGQQDLIKAFSAFVRQNKDLKPLLRLVGSGPTRSECQDLCHNFGISDLVEFCPEISHEGLVDFYNSLDLFILPSHFDGFGCVCLEAYACGVPFIICENQGACDYLLDDDKYKWSYLPGDCNTLTKLIQSFYINRWTQQVRFPIDIDILILNFLKEIGL